MDPLVLPLAYKFVATAAMLVEINYCASNLNLSCGLPVNRESLRLEYVTSPSIAGFGGALETDAFSFMFSGSGRLRYISRKQNRFAGMSPDKIQEEIDQKVSSLTKSEAYTLATNWLSSISVDVRALDKKYAAVVAQTPLYLDGRQFPEKGTYDTQQPIFHVDWGGSRAPAVRVAIYAPSRELLGLYQEDESFSGRPRDLLRNLDDLLMIPDEKFEKFSASERASLAAQYFSSSTGIAPAPSSPRPNEISPPQK